MAAPSRAMASTVGLLPVSYEETSASKSPRRSALLPVLICHYLILVVNNPGFHSQKKIHIPHPLFEMHCTGENSHS